MGSCAQYARSRGRDSGPTPGYELTAEFTNARSKLQAQTWADLSVGPEVEAGASGFGSPLFIGWGKRRREALCALVEIPLELVVGEPHFGLVGLPEPQARGGRTIDAVPDDTVNGQGSAESIQVENSGRVTFEWGAWANLAIRWLHLTAGIAWIGSSFYFMWLDSHLKAPASSLASK